MYMWDKVLTARSKEYNWTTCQGPFHDTELHARGHFTTLNYMSGTISRHWTTWQGPFHDTELHARGHFTTLNYMPGAISRHWTTCQGPFTVRVLCIVVNPTVTVEYRTAIQVFFLYLNLYTNPILMKREMRA